MDYTTSTRVSSTSLGVSNTPGSVFNTQEGVDNTLRAVNTTPLRVSIRLEGVSHTPEGVPDTPMRCVPPGRVSSTLTRAQVCPENPNLLGDQSPVDLLAITIPLVLSTLAGVSNTP